MFTTKVIMHDEGSTQVCIDGDLGIHAGVDVGSLPAGKLCPVNEISGHLPLSVMFFCPRCRTCLCVCDFVFVSVGGVGGGYGYRCAWPDRNHSKVFLSAMITRLEEDKKRGLTNFTEEESKASPFPQRYPNVLGESTARLPHH